MRAGSRSRQRLPRTQIGVSWGVVQGKDPKPLRAPPDRTIQRVFAARSPPIWRALHGLFGCRRDLEESLWWVGWRWACMIPRGPSVTPILGRLQGCRGRGDCALLPCLWGFLLENAEPAVAVAVSERRLLGRLETGLGWSCRTPPPWPPLPGSEGALVAAAPENKKHSLLPQGCPAELEISEKPRK